MKLAFPTRPCMNRVKFISRSNKEKDSRQYFWVTRYGDECRHTWVVVFIYCSTTVYLVRCSCVLFTILLSFVLEWKALYSTLLFFVIQWHILGIITEQSTIIILYHQVWMQQNRSMKSNLGDRKWFSKGSWWVIQVVCITRLCLGKRTFVTNHLFKYRMFEVLFSTLQDGHLLRHRNVR